MLLFNSNILPISGPLRGIHACIKLQNLSDIEWDILRSIKATSDVAIVLPLYDFILVVKNKYGLNKLLYEILDFEVVVTLTLTFEGQSRYVIVYSTPHHVISHNLVTLKYHLTRLPY